MKTTFKTESVLALSLCFILHFMFVGCSDDKDYYDPEYQTENPLRDVNIPMNFDWKATSTAELNVAANDEYDGKYYYLIEVFTENPVGEVSLNPIAQGFSKEGQLFSTWVTVPQNVENLYIRQTDPRKRTVTRCFPVTERINCDFAPTVSRSDLMRNAINRADNMAEPVYNDSYPADAVVVDPKNPGSVGSGSNYVIKEDYTGTLNFSRSGKLFIAPYVTLKVNALTIPSNLEIIVLKGASLMIEDAQLTIQGTLFIAPEATCYIKDVTTTSNSSRIENWGYLNMGHFRPNDNILLNYYHISCQTADIQSGVTFENYCHFHAEEEILVNQTKIYLDNGYIVSKKVRFDASEIYLKNASMVEAGTGYLDLLNSHFYAEGDRSLVKAPKITFNQGNAKNSSYNGPLTVEGVQDTKNSVTIGKGLENTVEFAEYEKSTVEIEVCTGIINPVYPGEEPGGGDGGSIIIQTDEGQYTYLFEDQWPLYGDYDMNDVVFKINGIITHQNKQNQVEKLKFNFTLQAVGAQKRLAGAVMFDKVLASAVKSVQYTNNAPLLFQTVNGVETEQANAVIPLFDEAHALMGKPNAWYINTVIDGPDNADAVSYTVTVDFANPVPVGDLNIEFFNFFVIDVTRIGTPDYSGRTEVHLRNYEPSSKAGTDYFGNHNDNSENGANYSSKDNLTWGIMVPDTFMWCEEQNDINDVYSGFVEWITSGGVSNIDWWKNPGSGVFSK